MTVDLLKDLNSKNENNVCYLIQSYLLSFPLFEDYIRQRAYYRGLPLLTSWKTKSILRDPWCLKSVTEIVVKKVAYVNSLRAVSQ